MKIESYDLARAAIEKTGFTDTVQSKISLFLIAAKNINAMFLGMFQLQPFVGVAHQFLHSQYFQEVEAVVLLSKVTRWTTDPGVYSESFRITMPLLQAGPVPVPAAAAAAAAAPASSADPRNFCQGMALGHALLSQVRISPVIPANCDETDPYIVALRRVEQDNARMIQTQINLLRVLSANMPEGEVEAIIEEKQEIVKAAFAKLLASLA